MHLQVVQAIGAAEAELLNCSLPKRIDGDGAINLINVVASAYSLELQPAFVCRWCRP